METVNIKAIQLDLKKPKLTTIGDFIQNDTNIIKFTLTDNGSVIDLDVIDQILINYKKPNGEIVSRIVTAEADVITYQLGLSEMSEPGLGKLVIQFFKSDNRISTFTVDVNIKKSIESNFSFEEAEKGLVDQVIQELNLVNTRIDNIAFDGVDTSKIATKEDLKTLATKTELNGLATKAELTGLATKTELSQRVKTINGQSPDTAGNINITPGSGTTPGNVLLFEDWIPGEPIIIGDGGTPAPPPNTAPNITSSFNMTSALTTTNISIPYSVTDAQGGNLTVTYTKNGTTNTATIATGANTWNVGTLTAGSNTLKIKVTDSGGLVSNELTFTIAATQPVEADTTPPNNVTNLVVSNNTTGTSLTLTWTASTSNDVAGYEIYRGTTLLTTITGTNYNVTGLTVNTSYTFTVKTKDTSNNVSSGTSVTVTTVYVDNIAPILTITPSATFTDAQTVTMTTNETATIFYTLDSTTPTQTSPVYSIPLTISATTTVKAFAKDAAGNLSSVQTVIYTKQGTIPDLPPGDYITSGLEIYYDFTTYTSTPQIADDLSGNGNNGQLNGYANTETSGISNGELIGDGIGDYIKINRTEKLKTYPFTVEFYLRVMYTDEILKKPSSLRIFDAQFDSNGAGSGVNIFANADSNATLPSTINLAGSLGQPNPMNVSHNLFDNQYTHVVVVFEATKQTIYVNGIQKGTQTSNAPSMTASTRNLFLLAAGNSTDSLKGAIKKFRYYTKALTSAEVTQNYNHAIQ